jgi:hypothetical protein
MVLEEMLPELLKEIPLSLRITMWFQNERAVAYLARQVREHFTATYNVCWLTPQVIGPHTI